MKPAAKLGLERPTKRAISRHAAKIESGEDVRIVVDVSESVRRAVKIRASEQGLSIRDYMLGLLRADGIGTE